MPIDSTLPDSELFVLKYLYKWNIYWYFSYSFKLVGLVILFCSADKNHGSPIKLPPPRKPLVHHSTMISRGLKSVLSWNLFLGKSAQIFSLIIDTFNASF